MSCGRGPGHWPVSLQKHTCTHFPLLCPGRTVPRRDGLTGAGGLKGRSREVGEKPLRQFRWHRGHHSLPHAQLPPHAWQLPARLWLWASEESGCWLSVGLPGRATSYLFPRPAETRLCIRASERRTGSQHGRGRFRLRWSLAPLQPGGEQGLSGTQELRWPLWEKVGQPLGTAASTSLELPRGASACPPGRAGRHGWAAAS